ncbi:PDR/VanB family oxidoreductase [Mycobacterium sp.]|uniref:PDR/VanB family oxidoreductase n=1 Tax=Mycobacterium sp. TaxID=1785 RepID=UPI003A863958
MAGPESSWESLPADLYGRRGRGRGRDRFFTVLWALNRMSRGMSVLSRWEPSWVPQVRRTHDATVVDRTVVAPDVVALTLADAGGGPLPVWTPGGHIDVLLPSGRRRKYSLCGRPGVRDHYRIAVRRIADGGGGSIEMHEAYHVGATLTFEGPRNAFHLGTLEREVVFVIGGIGVTPILPMMRVAQQRGIDWRAIYAGRSREYMPFLDEVSELARERLTVWADDERGGVPCVDDLLAGAGPATATYVCGPTAMLEAVRAVRAEHPGAPLHYERFSPPPIIDGVPFELELARSGDVVDVPANRSALEVMLDRDPTTAYSCRQGFCGTCKVTVSGGQVDRRGRTAEGDDEMLVCVSRSKGGRIVIDA